MNTSPLLCLTQAAKDAGNTSFRAGQFAAALAHYEEAIKLAPDNHVFYLNRAVTQLRLGHPEAAVADASSALAIKADYSKAYNTKGAALQQLGRTAEAIAVYRQGCVVGTLSDACVGGPHPCLSPTPPPRSLVHDPAHDTLLQNLRKAEDALRAAESGSAAAAAASTTPAAASAPAAAAPAPARVNKPVAPAPATAAASPAPPSSAGGASRSAALSPLWPRSLFLRGVLAGRLFIVAALLLSCVLALAGASGAATRLYYFMLLVAVGTHAADVLHRNGKPAATAEYAAKLSSDVSFPLIFLPLILYTAATPVVVGAVAALDFDVLHVGEWAYTASLTRGERGRE